MLKVVHVPDFTGTSFGQSQPQSGLPRTFAGIP
jgi:hypothetical protein